MASLPPAPSVYGIIDLVTLQDIHHSLNESMLTDDMELAGWVKKHFLYEPLVPGREIHTNEGFAKLHQAFCRVRSLTNKAQDKWPFFNHTWREMSRTDVRKYSQGGDAQAEAPPGVSSASPATSVSSGRSVCTNSTTANLPPFVPLGVAKPARYNLHQAQRKQPSPRPVRNTTIPLPPMTNQHPGGTAGQKRPADDREQTASRKRLKLDPAPVQEPFHDISPSELSKSHSPQQYDDAADPGVVSSVAKTRANTPQTPATIKSIPEDAMCAVECGKTRGVDGRFTPKENSKQCGSMSKARSPRKSQVSQIDTAGGRSPAAAIHGEKWIAQAPLTPVSDHDGQAKDVADDSSPCKATKPVTRVEEELTYRLAVYSESVMTNLDRLPAGSMLRKKRKSEAAAEARAQMKRKESSPSTARRTMRHSGASERAPASTA
ncbi:hypothetical protein ACEQ8H_000565 [Pleosporales sp. CAS-2024a]